MPRIIQNADTYRNNDFRRVVKMQLAGRELTQRDLAKALGICAAQASNILQHPERLTVERLRKIIQYLNLQPEDVLAFTGCKKERNRNEC